MSADTLYAVPQFLELDALLNDSLKQKAERDAEKELKVKVARNQGSPEDVALLRKWSKEREWTRVANVLSFSRQQCKNCGAFHTTLIGKFEDHTSNRIAGAKMQQAVPFFELETLPKRVLYVDQVVCICHDCADLADWPLED